MNILLTTSAAPKKNPFSTDEKRPPLGVGSLISILRNKKHKVFFIDNYLKPSRFIESGFLQKNKIKYVGIYANTICFKDTLRMINAIQRLKEKRLWQGKIIVGGPHTTVAVDTIPKVVDFIVQGEGERAILKIINGKAKTRIIREKKIENLDLLPRPPWDIFSKLPYDYTCPWMDIQPVFTMNTSRGCPYNCAFCSVGSIWGKQYTFFSADRIVEDIEYLIKYHNAKGIYFREDNFTLNLRRTEDFCRKLIKKKINISWACETRVNNLSEEMIKLMSSAGCRAFYFGVESGSQRILNLLKKGIAISQIENAVKWAKKYKIRAYCSLITGIPSETYEDYLMTKRLMNKLKPYTYAFNVFVGIPSGTLYQDILINKTYEYKDNLGLLYLPGYDVKTEFFYGRDSKEFVNHQFKKRNEIDYDLIKKLRGKKFFRKFKKFLLCE